NVDLWRIARKRAMDFVEVINRRGGDATFVSLPDMGIHGNTHAAFADLNNHEIYSQLEKWLAKKGLDVKDAPHQGPNSLPKEALPKPE
ncbi:MAG: hypothetical protein K2H64_02380, partial [Desulfovibrio sp.]|nr:hypothetical protein [Desulfovibrio sp.]